jgi:hypothetical protein
VANFTAGPVTLITSEPLGLRVVIDSMAATTPIGLAWAEGSSHTVEIADSTQLSISGAARYTFLGWSNDGDRSQTIITAGNAPYIARFRTEQQLVVLQPSLGNRIVATPGSDGTLQLPVEFRLRLAVLQVAGATPFADQRFQLSPEKPKPGVAVHGFLLAMELARADPSDDSSIVSPNSLCAVLWLRVALATPLGMQVVH